MYIEPHLVLFEGGESVQKFSTERPSPLIRIHFIPVSRRNRASPWRIWLCQHGKFTSVACAVPTGQIGRSSRGTGSVDTNNPTSSPSWDGTLISIGRRWHVFSSKYLRVQTTAVIRKSQPSGRTHDRVQLPLDAAAGPRITAQGSMLIHGRESSRPDHFIFRPNIDWHPGFLWTVAASFSLILKSRPSDRLVKNAIGVMISELEPSSF